MALYKSEMNSGGGGQLKETLLWENPSPSSDWPNYEVEVTLSDSYQNYDFLRFEIMDYKGDPTSPYREFTTRTASKEEWSKSKGEASINTYCLAVYQSGNGYFMRIAYHPASDGDNKVKFKYNYKVNTQASSFNFNIPYRIYGLKYS